MRSATAVLLVLFACSGETDLEPQPLDLPADPAESGVPVGVRTVEHAGLSLEVWYPATDDTSGQPDVLDFADFAPASVHEALGGLEVPPISTIAHRDADVRPAVEPYPVIVFSHGFGGNRVQSPELTAHLASRGFVVVSTDHSGRSLGDLLPCLFSPPLEGCDLAGFGDDPAPPDVAVLADWIAEAAVQGFLAGAIAPERLGIFGHSAGGGTTSAVLTDDPRFIAGAPMAGAGPVLRDVPTLILAGDCDGIVGYDGLVDATAQSVSAELVTVAGAGHLAFSDLCTLDLAGLAEDHLTGRDDVNATFVDMLLGLGTDGCPGHRPTLPTCGDAWLPLEVSSPILRHYLTVFFDEALYETGPGVEGGLFPEAALGR